MVVFRKEYSLKTTAVVAKKDIMTELQGNMTEELFKEKIKSQHEKSAEIDEVQAGANEKILKLHWELGTDLKETFFKDGTKGIGKYSEVTGISQTRVRRALSFATAYNKEQLKLAIKQGLHMGSIDALLRIEDEEKRLELGEKVAENDMTTQETRKLVKDAIEADASIEKPSSQKRSKETATQRRLDATNPVKAVPTCRMKLEAFSDSCTNLVESFANLDSALSADNSIRKGLIAEMDELVELVTSNRELMSDMEKELKERLAIAKSKK